MVGGDENVARCEISRDGAALNPLLGETARNMLIFTLLLTIAFIIYSHNTITTCP